MKNAKYYIVILIFLIGCDILSTRDPELPEAGRTSLLPATTPQILFSNLRESLEQKVTENYLVCFSDTNLVSAEFTFTPAVGAANRYSILNEWNKDCERRYFNNLKNLVTQNQTIDLTFYNEYSNIQAEYAIYQYDYTISVKLSSGVQEIYKGNSQFTIKTDKNNTWVITDWVDIGAEGSQSWSELKGRYYQ